MWQVGETFVVVRKHIFHLTTHLFVILPSILLYVSAHITVEINIIVTFPVFWPLAFILTCESVKPHKEIKF